MIKPLLSLSIVFLILIIPVNAMGQIDENVEFLIKNTNGDRIENQNIKLKIFNEKNEEIKTLSGSQHFVTSLPKNHMYQIDVYMADFLVSTDYFYFDKSSLENITVPNSHGVVFAVSYKDGKPFNDAEVILSSNHGTQLSKAITDLEGKTIRMWIPPTVKTGDFYEVTIKSGNLEHTVNNLSFLPSEQSQFSIKVPWPSITESLIEIELLDNASKKFNEKNYKFSLINQKTEINYAPTSVIKGNILISKIPYGDYSILMSEENSDNVYHSESFQINKIKKRRQFNWGNHFI